MSKHALEWMKNDSLSLWKISSKNLRLIDNVSMVNVCENVDWNSKLLTKPIKFLEHVQSIISSQSYLGESNLYVMFMDSDTYWSVSSVFEIWNRFDCARKGKQMLVSTEMSCWMGFYCTQEDTKIWYNNIVNTPSYSPFANSGVYIGRATIVRDMLSYIVANNKTYYTLDAYHKVMKFHDQHAVADYSIRVAPNLIQLDYHQQFAATFTVRISVGKLANSKASAVCKTRNGAFDYHCSDISAKLQSKYKYFRVNESNCQTYRHHTSDLPKNAMEELETLAPYPIVWHGNGAAKKIFLQLGKSTLKCWIRKFGLKFN